MTLVALLRTCDLCGSEYTVSPSAQTGSISADITVDTKTSKMFSLKTFIDDTEADLCPVCSHAFEDAVAGRKRRNVFKEDK
jgi:hypothetical protein